MTEEYLSNNTDNAVSIACFLEELIRKLDDVEFAKIMEVFRMLMRVYDFSMDCRCVCQYTNGELYGAIELDDLSLVVFNYNNGVLRHVLIPIDIVKRIIK